MFIFVRCPFVAIWRPFVMIILSPCCGFASLYGHSVSSYCSSIVRNINSHFTQRLWPRGPEPVSGGSCLIILPWFSVSLCVDLPAANSCCVCAASAITSKQEILQDEREDGEQVPIRRRVNHQKSHGRRLKNKTELVWNIARQKRRSSAPGSCNKWTSKWITQIRGTDRHTDWHHRQDETDTQTDRLTDRQTYIQQQAYYLRLPTEGSLM